MLWHQIQQPICSYSKSSISFVERKTECLSSKATVRTEETKSMSQNMREQLQAVTMKKRVMKDKSQRLKQQGEKRIGCNDF